VNIEPICQHWRVGVKFENVNDILLIIFGLGLVRCNPTNDEKNRTM
jgi:hypothetical protein